MPADKPSRPQAPCAAQARNASTATAALARPVQALSRDRSLTVRVASRPQLRRRQVEGPCRGAAHDLGTVAGGRMDASLGDHTWRGCCASPSKRAVLSDVWQYRTPGAANLDVR